jgi:hypothetical protein
MTKLPYVNVNFGSLLSIFMDKIFFCEKLTMFNIKNEFGLRSLVIGKFSEYQVPILPINSIPLFGLAYFLTSILNIVSVFKLKGKYKKTLGFIHLMVASVATMDVVFYSLVNLKFSDSNSSFLWTIFSVVSLAFVVLDLFNLARYSRRAHKKTEEFYSEIESLKLEDDELNVKFGNIHPFEGYSNIWQISDTRRKNFFTSNFQFLMTLKWVLMMIPIPLMQSDSIGLVWALVGINTVFFIYEWWVTAWYNLFSSKIALFSRVIADSFLWLFLLMCLVFAGDPQNRNFFKVTTEFFQQISLVLLFFPIPLEITAMVFGMFFTKV